MNDIFSIFPSRIALLRKAFFHRYLLTNRSYIRWKVFFIPPFCEHVASAPKSSTLMTISTWSFLRFSFTVYIFLWICLHFCFIRSFVRVFVCFFYLFVFFFGQFVILFAVTFTCAFFVWLLVICFNPKLAWLFDLVVSMRWLAVKFGLIFRVSIVAYDLICGMSDIGETKHISFKCIFNDFFPAYRMEKPVIIISQVAIILTALVSFIAGK